MEVHHPHHPSHKKKWSEYILEFFMLFLAVTLGFFAENVRESINKNEREIETIITLKQNLVKDTIRLNYLTTEYINTYESWVDSSHYYINHLNAKGNERIIIRSLFNATSWQTFYPPEFAYNLIQNPEAMNLLKNKNLKSELLNYASLLKTYSEYGKFIINTCQDVDTSFTHLCYPKDIRIIINKLVYSPNHFLNLNDMPSDLVLKTYDKKDFLHYLEKVDYADFKLKDIDFNYHEILNETKLLLNVINKEYPDLNSLVIK